MKKNLSKMRNRRTNCDCSWQSVLHTLILPDGLGYYIQYLLIAFVVLLLLLLLLWYWLKLVTKQFFEQFFHCSFHRGRQSGRAFVSEVLY